MDAAGLVTAVGVGVLLIAGLVSLIAGDSDGYDPSILISSSLICALVAPIFLRDVADEGVIAVFADEEARWFGIVTILSCSFAVVSLLRVVARNSLKAVLSRREHED